MAEVQADDMGMTHLVSDTQESIMVSNSGIPVHTMIETVDTSSQLEQLAHTDTLCISEHFDHDPNLSHEPPDKDPLESDVGIGSIAFSANPSGLHSGYQPIIYVSQNGGEISLATEDGILLTSDNHPPGLALEHDDFSLTAADHPVDGIASAEVCAGVPTVDSDVSYHPVVLSKGEEAILDHEQASEEMDTGNQLQEGMVVLRTNTGETFQVISLQELTRLAKSGQVVQSLPVENSHNLPGQIIDSNGAAVQLNSDKIDADCGGAVVGYNASMDSLTGILVSSSVSSSLPCGIPEWAARLRDCEKLGDSFRGWVESEIELDLLLTMHKQHTHSLWGTRQSPSPAKPSTRLMWKSQYVPFDGMPFVNAGSRAIVLECQFGPRRKGAHSKRQTANRENTKINEFKQTCPVRIYIKKVKKFPEYAVDMNQEKKQLKLSMDKAFIALREHGVKGHGQERYYVQLPTEEAHEFHGERSTEAPHRLHPKVSEKIRELVSGGETRLYVIRKMLRRFVEKELFSVDEIPEKHDLTYYPTVNDLQNHIHQAVRDMESGLLHVTAPTVKVEMIRGDCSEEELSVDEGGFPGSWQQWSSEEGQPHTESVTVTLTQNPSENGQHMISKVETYLSDGSTHVTTNLTPETANLLSKLHPNMFPGANAIQQQVLLTQKPEIDNSDTTPIVSSDIVDGITLTDAQPQYIMMEDE